MSVIKIKSFGDDSLCDNVDDLKRKLKSKYENKDVVITWDTKSGVQQVRFIKMLSNGKIIDNTDKEFSLEEVSQ
jgi:hypothetical protein